MKKLLSIVLVFLCCLCGFSAFAEEVEPITVSGLVDFDLTFKMIPEAWNENESEHPGTIERLHYETDVFEDGVTYQKYCTVYLPYGYDPQDTATKYNVLYLQHGSGGHPNELWDHQVLGQNARNMIDNMIDSGAMEPVIIICPTYYIGIDEEAYSVFKPEASSDGRDGDLPPRYWKEVIEDLIPQIESRYNVYCEDFSDEGIKATRDHRAWAGFSRGAVNTWDLFFHDFEYFRYWFPMSASIMPEGVAARSVEEGGYTTEEKLAMVRKVIEDNADLPFFLMMTFEHPEEEIARDDFLQGIYDMTDVFSYGLDPAVNNLYFTTSTYKHLDYYIPRYLYNALDVLFK